VRARSEAKLRVLALVHEGFAPPEGATEAEARPALWKTEYDVVKTLRAAGHDVLPLEVGGDLVPIRKAIDEWKPDIAWNLLEAFDDVATWDLNVVAYLEMAKVRYTGCNTRGLLLARDKAITKKLLSYHRIPVTDFAVFQIGRPAKRPKRLSFPLIVKSLTLDASIGISQASVVESEEKLAERVRFIHESTGTDALVESYVEGRELYVAILGNERVKVLPIWELLFTKMPEEQRKIATERLKWSLTYQKKHGIVSAEAKDLPEGAAARIQEICKRVYRNLMLSGYARIDLRLSENGSVYVIEANPNPQLARDEDFAQSAKAAGLDYGKLIQRITGLGMSWEPRRLG
jgi:D-alanine-D-alanine ligase